MIFSRAARYTHYGIMLLLLRQTAANCVGDTLNYTDSGIFVPFRNLCGKDVRASVDFRKLRVTNRKNCLVRCVMAERLCYGFDFLEHVETYNNPPREINCWLHGAEYTEQQTEFLGPNDSNAAMLMPDFRAEYQKKCGSRGLLDCLQEQLITTSSGSNTLPTSASSIASIPISSIPSDSMSSSLPTQASNDGLSTGAKAGIGAGAGAFALLAVIFIILLLLRRRKSKIRTDVYLDQPNQSIGGVKSATTKHASELKTQHTQELEAQDTQELGAQDTQELKGTSPVSGQRHIAELQ